MAPQSTPHEVTEHHSQLLKFALGVDETRDYLERRDPDTDAPTNLEAFEARWFGSRSEARVKIILRNMRARFDAYPKALRALTSWQSIDPRVRTLVCHWHTQLSDPTYRMFAGEYLPDRLTSASPSITLDKVVAWVEQEYPSDWSPSTTRQMASKLLSTAYHAGLLDSTQDKRHVIFPRVPDDALSYLMYLLRDVKIEGTLLENPYLRSVGFEGSLIEERLRTLDDVTFRRQGDLVDFDWAEQDLEAWGAARS
jgi:hypothetical protein